MTGPHVEQLDRDQIDDHNLIDQEPAGGDLDSRKAPVAPEALPNTHHTVTRNEVQ